MTLDSSRNHKIDIVQIYIQKKVLETLGEKSINIIISYLLALLFLFLFLLLYLIYI